MNIVSQHYASTEIALILHCPILSEYTCPILPEQFILNGTPLRSFTVKMRMLAITFKIFITKLLSGL